jgi:methyltransferase (TIGR00027 family)
MQRGKPSKTALRVAIRRAAHQLADHPPVLNDPVVVQLIGQEHKRDMERARHPVARDFRAYMAARSRYAEDRLAESFASGVRQYVVLGAGLDTFACRNPWPELRVFEVDYPATQEWKRGLLAEANINEPESLTFVPLDFEKKTLLNGLTEAGFDGTQPAYFSWLGVTPYLTLDAFRATLGVVIGLPKGTVLTLDYSFSPSTLTPERQQIHARLARKLAQMGESMRLFFAPSEMDSELGRAGFRHWEQLGTVELNHLYFRGRADGLWLSPVRIGRLVTAYK